MKCSILKNDLSMFLKSRTWINVDFKGILIFVVNSIHLG